MEVEDTVLYPFRFVVACMRAVRGRDVQWRFYQIWRRGVPTSAEKWEVQAVQFRPVVGDEKNKNGKRGESFREVWHVQKKQKNKKTDKQRQAITDHSTLSPPLSCKKEPRLGIFLPCLRDGQLSSSKRDEG